MKIYQANVLAMGVNKVFPHKVIIDDNTITISQPGVLSIEEKTILFKEHYK